MKNKKQNLPEIKNESEYDSSEQRKQDIKKWVDCFNKIPGMYALNISNFNPSFGHLININVPRSHRGFLTYIKEGQLLGSSGLFNLKENSEIIFSHVKGKADSTFSIWKKEFENSNIRTWSEVYDWLVKLSKKYQSI
ncbi:MAG: hypothetical protein WC264_02155 [Candidatus Paceibacterota bacterium]|jgi:hypothetical protein